MPSVDGGAIVVAPQAWFKVELHENGVVIHLQRGGPRRSWDLRGLEEMRGLRPEGAQISLHNFDFLGPNCVIIA